MVPFLSSILTATPRPTPFHIILSLAGSTLISSCDTFVLFEQPCNSGEWTSSVRRVQHDLKFCSEVTEFNFFVLLFSTLLGLMLLTLSATSASVARSLTLATVNGWLESTLCVRSCRGEFLEGLYCRYAIHWTLEGIAPCFLM